MIYGEKTQTQARSESVRKDSKLKENPHLLTGKQLERDGAFQNSPVMSWDIPDIIP